MVVADGSLLSRRCWPQARRVGVRPRGKVARGSLVACAAA